MLHLEVAQITLRLVVVEGNRQIVEEGEHLVLLIVVAILGEACLQVLHTCQQRKVLLAQVLILGFELGNPVVGRHVSMLHPLCKSD